MTTKQTTKPQEKSFADAVVDSFETVAKKVEDLFSSQPATTVDAVLRDHEALRNFIGVLKDPKHEMRERRQAYKLFSSLLKSHSVAEEKVVYATVDAFPVKDLQIKVAEGYVEHHVCDDLMARMEGLTDAKEWGAHANVLAELVEHHLKEEEDDMLPLIRKNVSPEIDETMLVQYMDMREATQKTVRDDNAGVLKSAQ